MYSCKRAYIGILCKAAFWQPLNNSPSLFARRWVEDVLSRATLKNTSSGPAKNYFPKESWNLYRKSRLNSTLSKKTKKKEFATRDWSQIPTRALRRVQPPSLKPAVKAIIGSRLKPIQVWSDGKRRKRHYRLPLCTLSDRFEDFWESRCRLIPDSMTQAIVRMTYPILRAAHISKYVIIVVTTVNICFRRMPTYGRLERGSRLTPFR